MTDDYLADTSVFVAAEQRRALGDPPNGDARISVATLTELIVGVRRAAAFTLRPPSALLRKPKLDKSAGFEQ